MGDRITALRQRRGWSQNMLAERAGVDKSQLSRLVRGLSPKPGHETIRKLADALRVPLSELTGERPMPKRQAVVTEGVVVVPLMRLRVQASGEPTWDDANDTVTTLASNAAGRSDEARGHADKTVDAYLSGDDRGANGVPE